MASSHAATAASGKESGGGGPPALAQLCHPLAMTLDRILDLSGPRFPCLKMATTPVTCFQDRCVTPLRGAASVGGAGGWCFARGTTDSLAPALGWPQTNILTLSALDPVAGAKAWGKVPLLLGWAFRTLAPANVLHLPTTTHLLPPSRSHLPLSWLFSLSFLCGSSWA